MRTLNVLPHPAFRLAQAAASTVYHVTVVDKRGNPYVQAGVNLQDASGAQMAGSTDAKGIATFSGVAPGDVTVDVTLPNGMKIHSVGNSQSDLFVEVPLCAPVPLVTNTEIVVFVGGAALAAAGMIFKVKTFEVLGELSLGGGLFSAIYRNSCGW